MFLLYTHKIHHSAKKKKQIMCIFWVFHGFLYGFCMVLLQLSIKSPPEHPEHPSFHLRRHKTLVPTEKCRQDGGWTPWLPSNHWDDLSPMGWSGIWKYEWDIYKYIYILWYIYIYIQIVVTIIPFWDINGILQYEWWFNQPKYCRGGYCNSWWNNEVQLIILVISYNHRYIGNIHMNGI